MSKQRAANMLWPQKASRLAIQSLYKAIQVLKNWRSGGHTLPIHDTRGSISVEVAEIRLDTRDFLRLYASRNPDDWAEACDLYRSGFLADESFEWITDYDGFYEIRHSQMCRKLASYYQSRGDGLRAAYYRGDL